MPKHFFIAILTFYLMSTAVVAQASLKLPATVKVEAAALTAEPMCDPKISPAWREAQEIDGVKIDASPGCSPDNPVWIAAAVKGTNNISMDTLMKTGLSPDAIIKTDDIDGDGDGTQWPFTGFPRYRADFRHRSGCATWCLGVCTQDQRYVNREL